ncbi:hypothetical protein LTR05_007344 [Lithohypha guttulata]|uniref:Nitrate/nitrite transporter n=1 Tax=Lithohypha guttulata TaxID=1690604 RepID=A0AAN7SV15_9EURO|nr:hypothetical protein LTR05_007344 [Lithohypha guttulata]
MTITIRRDLDLSTVDVANSNIAALTGTLIVRFVAGPLCDRFGPRYTFIGVLLCGSIPTALAGAVYNVQGLIALRFFVGILGGTFVPCQVWSTGFFDKNVVGSSNALIGGWGNSGGGITYFAMPAIYDSLVQDRGLSSHVAWRVAFIVPFILIVTTALGMLFLCPDTPTGKWSERHLATQRLLNAHGVHETVVDQPGSINARNDSDESSGTATPKDIKEKTSTPGDVESGSIIPTAGKEVPLSQQDMLEVAKGEIVVAPTFKEALHIVLSLQTLFHSMTYVCSFGGELAINSYIASYYLKNFPSLGQTGAGRWGSMFGLLNVITRPAGGFVADILYKYTKSLWVKKAWIVFVGVVSGAFLIAIGLIDPHTEGLMFGLIAGMAVFLEAGNGANFALVPHVHPFGNGIMSGTVGAAGNLGGVIFAILFRFHGTDYASSFWIMGVMIIGLNLAGAWIRPLPAGQIGGK